MQGNGVAHDFGVAVGTSVEHGYDFALQLVVKRSHLERGIFRYLAAADGPAGDAFNVTFGPPAVDYAEAGDAVHSAGHTPRQESLVRKRVVEDTGVDLGG